MVVFGGPCKTPSWKILGRSGDFPVWAAKEGRGLRPASHASQRRGKRSDWLVSACSLVRWTGGVACPPEHLGWVWGGQNAVQPPFGPAFGISLVSFRNCPAGSDRCVTHHPRHASGSSMGQSVSEQRVKYTLQAYSMYRHSYRYGSPLPPPPFLPTSSRPSFPQPRDRPVAKLRRAAGTSLGRRMEPEGSSALVPLVSLVSFCSRAPPQTRGEGAGRTLGRQARRLRLVTGAIDGCLTLSRWPVGCARLGLRAPVHWPWTRS